MKNRKHNNRKLLILFLVLSLVAGLLMPHGTSLAKSSKKISLNKSKVTLTVGGSAKLKLKNAKAAKVKWKSSNKKVAKVSKTGKVVAKKKGKCVIKATYRKKTYRCNVVVKAKKTAGNSTTLENRNESVFTSDVTTAFAGNSDYQLEQGAADGTVKATVAASSGDVQAGEIVKLPANAEFGEDVFIKVVSSKKTDGGVEIVGTIPDNIFDVYDEVKVQGSAGTLGEITLGEGVRELSDAKRLSHPMLLAGIDTKYLNLYKKCTLPISDTVSATVEIDIPKINYDFEFNQTGVNRLLFELPENAFTVTLSGKVEGETSKRLFSQQILDLGLDGLTVDLSLYLTVRASGEVSVSYTISNDVGIEYANGKISPINDVKLTKETIDASVDAEMGFDGAVEIYFERKLRELFSKEQVQPLYDIGLGIGAGAAIETTIHRDRDLACTDGIIYGYLRFDAGKRSDLAELLKDYVDLTYDTYIFGKDTANNPLRKSKHWENGSEVPFCTYESDDEDGNESTDTQGGTDQNPTKTDISEKVLNQAYKALYEKIMKDPDYYVKYALIHVDDDGIPELIAVKNDDDVIGFEIRKIVTEIDGDDLSSPVCAWLDGMCGDTVYSKEYNTETTYNAYYIQGSGKICQTIETKQGSKLLTRQFITEDVIGSECIFANNGVYHALLGIYEWNGAEVTKKEYQNACKKAFDLTKATSFADLDYMSKAEMLSFL